MSNVIQTIEELDAVLHWRNKHAIAIKERDALQLRLNAADQRIDELTQRQGEPVAYAAFADNGNIRCWSSNCEVVGLKVLAEGGSEIVPLYRHPAEQIAADALKAFANEMINASFEGGSFDGGDIQDIAAKHGLLRIEPRNEECGEVCACREYGFPAECYRKTDLIANTPQ
ncbi:hypothetical protein [Pseudomonas iridis]|uniref:hypothetical protein n=1 Tax=Pseudomonas iridis TaxID=2710587 RepID=UPI001B31CB27|nr:hypothetical protein [Pseudomonas iridis]MBP5969416.1 hypothetical protein [Pseudomonas iridis]